MSEGRTEQKIVFMSEGRSFLVAGDADVPGGGRAAGHVLPMLLSDGWTIRSVTAGSSGANAYVLLERPARAGDPPRRHPRVHLPAALLEQMLDAVAALADSPLNLTLDALEEHAIRCELRRLAEKYNGGDPFPPRHGRPVAGWDHPSRSPAAETHDPERHRRIRLPVKLFREALDAVAALSGAPHFLTMEKLEEHALRKELDNLRFTLWGGKPFPPHDGPKSGSGAPVESGPILETTPADPES